ncbi:probable prolyl 4-hydroxylase 10 isoform X2 [Vigna unguiculata]|uniref:probable prolyl 4-hydroxylase 10 isoform X2 n=1 Tax=Vigna unguiculata TaxID=3917 RepID=UPI0010169A3F|nr:probable prolyl 4-hydroxylase 10 isoform X2 [Vigna unguiculata]
MVKARHSRLQKSWITRWSWVLVLAVLTMCMSLLILLLLALHLLSMPNTNTSFAPFKHNHLNSIARNASYISEGEDEQTERWVEILSWEPRAFLYHNFLTKEECEYLINIAKPNMKRSTVIETETGIIKTSSERTSFGTLLARGLDKTVRNIEKRIADFTHVPVENGEALQIVHYEVGEEYVPHHDYFMDDLHTANGGDRMATMLISDVEEGGETVFPDAKVNLRSVGGWNQLSDCGRKGLSIKPKMGDALLFWSMKPDLTYDPSSFHGSCPVIKGNKWSCTKWMRIYEFQI